MTTSFSQHPPAAAQLQTDAININEESSVNYWLSALGCSELELRMAVAEVGSLAGDVGNRLGRVL